MTNRGKIAFRPTLENLLKINMFVAKCGFSYFPIGIDIKNE